MMNWLLIVVIRVLLTKVTVLFLYIGVNSDFVV